MKKGTKKYYFGKYVVYIVLCLLGWCFCLQEAEASLLKNPNITISPDGNAFTTNADEKKTEWYDSGYTVLTGKTSALKTPETGEHLYSVINDDIVDIGKWVVAHERGQCIHVRMVDVPNFHGVMFEKSICFSEYYSGWMGYCADCNQKVTSGLFYMSDDTAYSLTELDMSMAYYYRCPHCTHLEQGYELKHHICQAVSPNQYSVRYHANYGSGYMPKSIHMYNNATIYEGAEVTPQKTLTLNSYTRIGYEFAGWNTEIDGSGTAFADGEEILNLCSEEQGSIILYAQWKKSQSILEIDPNGGEYQGSKNISRIQGLYGSTYEMQDKDLEPPLGAIISFEEFGGEEVEDILSFMTFKEWSFTLPMKGEFENNIYIYKGKNAETDRATAIYSYKTIVLPECTKPGYSFGGWYLKENGENPVGMAGDTFLASEDVTLYAKWVELRLDSEINSIANNGKGAVDLSWSQKDNLKKNYRLYQKEINGDWTEIYSADDIAVGKQLHQKILFSGKEGTFVVPYGGHYQVTLYGAQGGNTTTHSGGKGGMVTAYIYFEAGEILQYNIGGQSGYNGGGQATRYANGGGYSILSTKESGIIMIAGGGGGATSLQNGRAGGSKQGVISGYYGQSGMAGGGGGYNGGAAGKTVFHNHSPECSHEHIGEPAVEGGCYTQEVVCGNTQFTKEKYKENFYYGNVDDNGNHIYCVRCGSYECPGHKDSVYRYICTVCGARYNKKQPASCTETTYGLGCDQEAGYSCGYEEDEVIGAEAAFGGSNYVNLDVCQVYDEVAGVQEGNGQLIIEAVQVGFVDNNYLHGVAATDKNAPEAVSPDTVEIEPVDANKVNVVFARPADTGTTYYHKAESYNRTTNRKISTSNLTVDTLVSGVVGYKYIVNESENARIEELNRYLSYAGTEPYIGVVMGDAVRYLHIAAVDRSGNCSEIISVKLSKKEVIFWPVITEKINIKKEPWVYQRENAYYVKADGTTSFEISFDSRLCGTALPEYQINQVGICVTESDTAAEGIIYMNIPTAKNMGAGSEVYRNADIRKLYAGEFVLTDTSFTEVRRNNYCKDVEVVQTFSVPRELDGSKIILTPSAAVVTTDIKVFSDKESDQKNGIVILADGEGPEIKGLEELENIQNQDGEWEYDLLIEVEDGGSGLQSASLEILNQDNGGYERVDAHDGIIKIRLNSEQAIFLGNFIVTVTAVDNVGNESVSSYGMDGIAIHAYVENLQGFPQTQFKKGQPGRLQISGSGYMEQIEVYFPQEWSEYDPTLNKVYQYEKTEFLKKETLEFAVPLNIPEGEYTINVRGYKGDTMAEADVKLLAIQVKGSVLDDIRTRLR